jgi:hypothetical protein
VVDISPAVKTLGSIRHAALSHVVTMLASTPATQTLELSFVVAPVSAAVVAVTVITSDTLSATFPDVAAVATRAVGAPRVVLIVLAFWLVISSGARPEPLAVINRFAFLRRSTLRSYCSFASSLEIYVVKEYILSHVFILSVSEIFRVRHNFANLLLRGQSY